MQAILTTYRGPTNHHGSRIIARSDARRVTVPYDHALDLAQNHRMAAMTLVATLQWGDPTQWVSGTLPTQDHAHVYHG